MRAVLFDLDETLLDRTASLRAFLPDQYRRLARKLGEVTQAAWCARFLALDARGSVHKSVVYPALLAEFGGDASAAAELLDDYLQHCCRHARPFDGMAATLAGLRERGLRLGIVSNGETVFQNRHVAALGLHELVDAVLVSQAEGLRKPDARLFHLAASRLGVQPAGCLFVGDNAAADVLGAHAAGMRTAWFRCGQTWPADLQPNPGPVIERLDDVLRLVG